ncbi:MAG: DAK2 domain-containing protein [Anaerolineaceae bacterium]
MATTQGVDLAKVFGTVAKTLGENRDSLNQADEYNHDHGDNMVQTFDVITRAMKEKKNAAPADQLEYAAQLLRQQTNSGSSQLYAQGLTDASTSLAGQKTITADNAMQLIQALLGAGQTPTQAPAAGGDLLGTLLGGLGGGQTQQAPAEGGDLLGGLLGGLTGGTGTSGSQQGGGIDLNTLLNAGMSYMQTKQSGGSNMDALLNAVVGSSRMNSSAARSQSGTLVANTLMQVLSKALQK